MRSSWTDSARLNSRTPTVAAIGRQAGLREVISTWPDPSGNHRDRARGSSALSNTTSQRSRRASSPNSRATPTPTGVVAAVSSRAMASSASRSGISAGSSAGTHQAMSNSSWWRWAYSIAAVVLPIPPIPVTACTTVDPPNRSAASSPASRSVRPMNPRTRPGIVHARRSMAGSAVLVGADCGSGRGSAVRACSNAVSNSPGLVTVAVVTPLPASRPRNACWRAPCCRSPNIAAGPSVSSPSRNANRGMPRCSAVSCSSSV